MKNNSSSLRFISEVAGHGKLYIVFLLLVQMILGISSVFYALLLRGLIDGAVNHDRNKMLFYIAFLVALVVLLVIEPRFACILVPGGSLLVLLTYIFRKQLKNLHKQMQEKDGLVRIFLQEHLGSLMIVKAFGRESACLTQASEHMEEHKKARMRKNHFSNICNIGFGAVMNGAYVAGAVYGVFGIYNGTMSYGTLMAMLQLISQVQNPFANITGYLPKYFAMLASVERLMEIESYMEDEENVRLLSSKKIPRNQTTENLCGNDCVFGLFHVDFAYHLSAVAEDETVMTVVLKNYSLEVRKGEFVAFTGPSGCGKSTVLKLMIGLYKAKAGTVYGCRRSMFAYVPQGNQLMSGSIRDIITFSDDSKSYDECSIHRALQIANAEDFVEELEQGIDTMLGERGAGLSEGQMQRLAIARAVYSDRPVLLLDEATSALDAEIERTVLENLRNMTDKTVIIVTHRPAALKLCDRQIAFEEVTCDGTN